jgi:hypothetical protein
MTQNGAPNYAAPHRAISCGELVHQRASSIDPAERGRARWRREQNRRTMHQSEDLRWQVDARGALQNAFFHAEHAAQRVQRNQPG